LPPLFLTNYIILKNFFIKNLFFAQAQFVGEREGERGRLHSSVPLYFFTLSLIPLPSKGEGKST